MTQDKIANRARLIAHFATLSIILLPICVIIGLATGVLTPDALRSAYGLAVMQDDPGVVPLAIWAAVEAATFALMLYLIWCVRAWLLACAAGDVFKAKTARHIRRIGTSLLGLAGAQVVGHTIIVLALTWNNPVGQRSFTVAFGSAELFMCLAAALVMLLGWIQAEAARLAAENQSFV